MSLLELTPEQLDPTLPSLVTPESQDFYAALNRRLEEIVETVGPIRGSAFARRMEEIRRAAPDETAMIAAMPRKTYILPLLALWREERQDGAVPPPTPRLLAHVERLGDSTPRGRLSRLALRELFLLFCGRYDEIEMTNLNELCALLQRQLNKYMPQELLFGLDKFKAQASHFLCAEGHRYLAELTENSGKTLEAMAGQYGIPTHDSRFFEAAQMAYYVLRLKKLAPNEENDVLFEVQDRNVYDKRLDAKDRLGHAVLRILIDTLRDAGKTPSGLWRATLLAIGGDPRVPPANQDFMNWWMPLGNRYIQQMIEWLSELDLELFLKIFEELAQTNPDMANMFPARATFLRGLLKKKLIRSTRLFLSRRAADYVERNWQANERPVFTRLAGGARGFAAFYLNLGTAHMVEGTHSFALRMMDQIPAQSPLLLFEDIPYQYLTGRPPNNPNGLEGQYYQQFGEPGYFLRVIHNPDWQPWAGNSWQEKAVNHLRRLKVDVLLSDVTTANPYGVRL